MKIHICIRPWDSGTTIYTNRENGALYIKGTIFYEIGSMKHNYIYSLSYELDTVKNMSKVQPFNVIFQFPTYQLLRIKYPTILFIHMFHTLTHIYRQSSIPLTTCTKYIHIIRNIH
jgi:hypothetical protein